jgi:hypothetical protein
MRGGKYGTSHVDNRVTKARMGYSAANRLPLSLLLGGYPLPLPSRYVDADVNLNRRYLHLPED